MTAILAGAEERADGLEKGKITYYTLKNPGLGGNLIQCVQHTELLSIKDIQRCISVLFQ